MERKPSFSVKTLRWLEWLCLQSLMYLFLSEKKDAERLCLIFHSVPEMGKSSMERDGDMEGAAAHCLWQEGREGGREGERRGIKTISSLLLLL